MNGFGHGQSVDDARPLDTRLCGVMNVLRTHVRALWLEDYPLKKRVQRSVL